jgi:hypothetical protein
MLLGESIRSIVAEHIEDVAVEYDWGWLFLQVKTRNPSRGPWRLSDVVADGGGLHSLYRAHIALRDVDARLELHLEGHIAVNDLLAELLIPLGPRSADLCERVSNGLQIPVEEVMSFLARLTVREAALRDDIRSVNVATLGERTGRLTMSTISTVYNQIIDAISRAMEHELGSEARFCYIVSPNDVPNSLRDRVNRKRLTRVTLDRQRRILTPPIGLLLAPVLDRDATEITDLERKMREAGAPSELVERARSLRANASRREIELLAKSLEAEDARLVDLQERLLTTAVASASVHRGQPRAAAHVFNNLLTSVHANSGVLDPHGLFSQDPMLLLGEICELSDQCKCDWGA